MNDTQTRKSSAFGLSAAVRAGKLRLRTLIPIVLVLMQGTLGAQQVTHTVTANETIYSIARSYGVEPAALLSANHISDPRTLRIGTVLVIPTAYRVVKGDTLYGIARANGIALDTLLTLNGFDTKHVLHVGDVVLIPASGGDGTRVASQTPATGTAVATGAATTGAGSAGTSSTNQGAQGTATTAGGTSSSAASGAAPGDTAASSSGAAVSVTSATENQSVARPVTVSIAGAASTGGTDIPWPHPGTRYTLTGKFPGLLIKGKPGDTVVCVAEGKVIYTGPYSTFGNVVLVQSSTGYVYVYGGNDKLSVAPGDHVREGTVLGTLAKSFFQDGAEVYFSVWKDNEFIDPANAPRG